jgi:hypothetical protein
MVSRYRTVTIPGVKIQQTISDPSERPNLDHSRKPENSAPRNELASTIFDFVFIGGEWVASLLARFDDATDRQVADI